MSNPKGLKICFGTASFGSDRPFKDSASVAAALELLDKLNIHSLDTAQIYGAGWSEEVLGECEAGKRFSIDTKAYGGIKPGSSAEEPIVEKALESLRKMKVDRVDIFYIHAPDPEVPLSSTLAGVNTLYKRGLFSRFGLSNYKASEVEEVYEYCKTHDYVLPTVYQGNYNPVARLQETVLFPTLRKLNIAFYAYSPLAGGFLTKTKQQVVDGIGRFNPDTPVGKMYRGLYNKPSYLEALAEWERVAREDEDGCDRAELAYRWVSFNSDLRADLGDAIIIGASRPDQIEQTVRGLQKGPLSEKACKGIDKVWDTIKHEAPLDNMNP